MSKTICVIYAMDKEGEWLKDLLELSHDEISSWKTYKVGNLKNGTKIVLAKCGVGKVNAALTTYDVIRSYRPDVVINTGCCGGNPFTDIKQFDIVKPSVNRMVGVFCAGMEEQEYSIKDREPTFKIPLGNYIGANIREVRMNTSNDRFVMYKDFQNFQPTYPDAYAYDMEYAVIAQICEKYKIPHTCFRVVSDVATPDGSNHLDDFFAFFNEKDNKYSTFIKYVINRASELIKDKE